MMKLFLFALATCLIAPLGMAQDRDSLFSPPVSGKLDNSCQNSRGLGDALWVLDVETISGGDNQCLGVEFDGNNYWVTGKGGSVNNASLYEISPGGVLVNKFDQPAGNQGGPWGWRDLAWDGQYLYAGDDSNAPGYITKIDPADGSVVELLGPYPVVPCRAIAYDPVEDVFWTASWNSNLYKCFRDGTSQAYANPLAGMYGAAAETSTGITKIWWWSQDGPNSCQANEMLTDGTFTGKTFEGNTTFYGGGEAGGAGAYDTGGGSWELVGLSQGVPDHIVGYDLHTITAPLEITPDEVSAWYGGTLSFSLNGGSGVAGHNFVILGSASGTSPGFNLPSGLHMDLNWDYFTDRALDLAVGGGYGMMVNFIGTLNENGMASARLTLAGHCQLYEDLEVCFAWCTFDSFDFVSNSVYATLTGAPPPPDEYSYDDGSTENLLGYIAGGEKAWLNYFPRNIHLPTISEIGTIWGCAKYPGHGPGNGTTAYIGLWEDPTADNDPSDAYLAVGPIAVTTMNYDTDIMTWYSIGSTYTLQEGGFFVGVWLDHVPGEYIVPMDESQNPTNGRSWSMGNPGGTFNTTLSANSDITNMKFGGFDSYVCVRAK
ncbi:MAG: hypothetical protein KJ645_14855 [Planctomycetes bacterium]|nr:hypothetical protein [Planctomycetota bacterium]